MVAASKRFFRFFMLMLLILTLAHVAHPMAEPFVFYFSPGLGGHPELMYITDLECACSLCGQPGLQRFYHSTSWHPLNLYVWQDLSKNARHKASYACENCGSAVGPDHVARAVLRLGFADDAGCIVTFIDYIDKETPRILHQLIPDLRLDPQVQPAFDLPLDVELLQQLEEALFEARLHRPFHIKAAVRSLIEDWLDDPVGGAFAQIAPGFWCFIDEHEDAALAWIKEAQHSAPNGVELAKSSMWSIALHDSMPEHLSTHKNPAAMSGKWTEWTSARALDAIYAGRMHVEFMVDESLAMNAMERAFSVARLLWHRATHTDEEQGEHTVLSQIMTPREGLYPHDVSLPEVLRRAVYTGLTPGEAGRLTAEEIVGVLLRVWK